jgi:predicted RNA binding protein YcfA (HicA-like mRNA interferase family)
LPKLPVASGRDTIRAFGRIDYEFLRQRGSHVTLINRETRRTIVIPVHANRPLRPGTLRHIIRQAGLTVEEFTGLLE